MSFPDTTALLAWFDTEERELPWRHPNTPAWHILISEVMAQQTPVMRVVPLWQQWISRWPTPKDLANAPTPEVIRAWANLGYPRRALRLQECAAEIDRRFSGVVPNDVETLLTLPGIGDYTARAICAFAYHAAVPVVDTNVRRVIARAVHGLGNQGPPRRQDLDDAKALLPVNKAARFSAAIMELGALVCTAQNPQCQRCPIASCAWVAAGKPPYTGPTKKPQGYAGTDRQVRGKILALLRESHTAVTKNSIDQVWLVDSGQRERALASLLDDGLIEVTLSGLFGLAGTETPSPV